MTTTGSEASPRKLIPTSQTISVLPTNTARVYTNIHPVLILSLYYLCFSSLVADPVSTLKKAVAPLAHLQITYCVVCLPPFAGSSSPKVEAPKSSKKKKVQFAHSAKGPATKPATIASRITVRIFCTKAFNVFTPANLHDYNLLARDLFSRPVFAPRNTRPHRDVDSLRCFHQLLSLAYNSLRNTHVAPWCSSALLYSRCGLSNVEGNIGSLLAI